MKQYFLALLLIPCWLGTTSVSRSADDEGLELVQNSSSKYVISIPKNASHDIAVAAETLRDYLNIVSGAKLPVIQGTAPQSECIVLEISQENIAGSIAKKYGNDGFRIQTSNRRLILTAQTAQGFRNAVYTFLETYLNCRKYSPSVEVIPHRSSITLPYIDDTQIPALTFRLQDFRDSSYSVWHKLSSLDDWGLFVHTFETLVPAEKYFKEHPEYFSESNDVRVSDGQLCLSNPDVFRIVVDELRCRMKEKPGAQFWSFSQNDTYLPCNCEACSAVDKAEGSQSGSLIRFVNKVAAEFPDKTISTLAYQYSRAAPTLTKPAPNVNIMLCSIECNRSQPIDDDTQNASFAKDIRDWSQLTHSIFLWDYVIQFRNLVSPFPNLRILQPNMQFFVENGINAVFEQGVSEMHGEFAELRAYLISKLLWNPNVNVDSVMNDFLKGYYGDAAPFIRQYIDNMHDALEKSGEELSCFGYPFPSKNGYLSATMIDRYVALFDQAESAVSKQPDILLRVQTARLPLQYAQLEQAKLLADAERGCFERNSSRARQVRPTVYALLDTFYVRCIRAGIFKLWEHGIPPQEYFDATQRFLTGSTEQHKALRRPVTLSIPASDKYHNGEASTLTDGIIGWNDYHMHWLGFEGVDMDATIDLGQAETISHIETSFLQDINSWVFMPRSVEFLASEDGIHYQTLGVVKCTIDPHENAALTSPFELQFTPKRARFIQVRATSLKQCPTWHKGSGGKAWIFCDEIKIF